MLSPQWMPVITAFSTIAIGRVVLASPARRVPVACVHQGEAEPISSVPDKNATDPTSTEGDASTKEKAAIVFLHGLGDSPDGWASLAEALPTLRPSLATLDITYVFPPAQTIGITVNGGEKMLGRSDWMALSVCPLRT